MVELLLMAPISALIAIIFAGFLARYVLSQDTGTPKMREIAGAIQEGSKAYLSRQYKVISVVALVLTVVLYYAINLPTAIGFIVGAFLSALAGYIGMSMSVRANVRTAEAAKKGLDAALKVSFRGGAVAGFSIVGMSLLGLSTLYYIYRDPLLIVGFAFGASLISLFARIGGGIYTKAADVGADLIGKVEVGIPEDDPRNPAVIADNVGDNVGDCAGMGADLFETYAVTAVAAMLLGFLLFEANSFVIYPLLLGSVAIIGSIIGLFFVRLGKKKRIMAAMYKGALAASIFSAIGFYYVTKMIGLEVSLFYAALVGLLVKLLIIASTEYFTSHRYTPVKSIAEASLTGPGTNIITGLAIGLKSTAFPVLIISGGIIGAYYFGGIYGVAIAAVAMLSTTGIIIALDTYGPITDNAGGIAEMAKMNKKVRNITDELDAVGNTTKAVTKGYAIGSAALGALALFAAYVQETKITEFNITDPLVLVGLFIGGMLPFIFSAFTMQAVGVTAFKIVNEVRRQFKEIPGIMKGTARPQYGRCVDIVTKAAQREMIVPGMLAILAPLLVGFILGPVALGGLLVGVIITGLMLAIQMTGGGAAWDNAKKYIETGEHGGKGSDAHKAAVVGDTVGDPFKDTAGPALNALIKVMNTISIIFAPLIVQYSLQIL